MKKGLIASATGIALIASLFVSTINTAQAALRVPKQAWPSCSVAPGQYCVDSVVVTDARGKLIPLVWVPTGSAVPAAASNAGVRFAPIAIVNSKGVVLQNNWWLSQTQRDILTSGGAQFIDAYSLIGTADMPAQGAQQDPTTKDWDLTWTTSAFSQTVDCYNTSTQTTSQVSYIECYKGAMLVVKDGEVKFILNYQSAAEAAAVVANYSASTFVDLDSLASKNTQPMLNSKYDSKTKTFAKTEPLITPAWVTNNSLVNGWDVAGQPNTVAEVPATSTDSSTAIAPLAADPGSSMVSPVEAGSRNFSGRWTTANWNSLGLNALGYDGLYVDAKAANEFVNHVLVDVLPTLTDANNRVALAGQAGNRAYATNLDPDVSISVKLRTGEIKTGVTVAVGVDTEVRQTSDQTGSSITVSGNPVSVAIAKSQADCSGESGKAIANVRQFQTLIVAQNDSSGFGVDGVSGNMYVGSNGTCILSTPIWHDDTKSFTWTTAAPHFASDGVTQNKGFYKAVIPFKDAALLWGLTNPADAATALVVSVTTEAGGSTAAISVVSAKDNNIVIDVSGFGFSKPKLSIAIKPGYKPSKKKIAALPQSKSTVICVMGKTTKKITAVKPVCPKGYRKMV